MTVVDTHCRIGKVRLKGSRNISKHLPLKSIRVFQELTAAKLRASSSILDDEGKGV